MKLTPLCPCCMAPTEMSWDRDGYGCTNPVCSGFLAGETYAQTPPWRRRLEWWGPLGVLASRDGLRYTKLGWWLGYYLCRPWPWLCQWRGHKPKRYGFEYITIACERCHEELRSP